MERVKCVILGVFIRFEKFLIYQVAFVKEFQLELIAFAVLFDGHPVNIFIMYINHDCTIFSVIFSINSLAIF